MVEVGTGSSGTRFINKDWPITEGLEAGTNKLREKPHLEAEIDLTELNSGVLL